METPLPPKLQQPGSRTKASSLPQRQGSSPQTKTSFLPKADHQICHQKSGSLHLQVNANNCMEKASLMVENEGIPTCVSDAATSWQLAAAGVT